MNGSANVQSFDAICAVRAALLAFSDQVEDALATIDIEMRRVVDWLEHDRPRYWRTRVREANDEVSAARAALHRCLMYPIGNERPSCREERAALKRAQAQLAYCEEKCERLRHWTREVRHEMFEYEGRIRQVNEIIEYDVPQAVGILNKLLTRLEEYQSIRLETGGAAAEGTTGGGADLVEELWPTEPTSADNDQRNGVDHEQDHAEHEQEEPDR